MARLLSSTFPLRLLVYPLIFTSPLPILDAISLKKLKRAQETARISNIEAARQVAMAPSAVLERIRTMECQGIIDGYEVRLNPGRHP